MTNLKGKQKSKDIQYLKKYKHYVFKILVYNTSMDKSGIISQRGFEYQKLVFVYNSLLINGEQTLGYECLDDMSIQTVENAIIKSNDRLIQVKSGEVNQTVFYKILINWLLKYNLSYKYTLYSENEINFDFKSREYIDDVTEKILNSKVSNKSNISKARDAFSANKNKISSAILHIVSNLEINLYEVESLKKQTFDTFKDRFGVDSNNDIAEKQLDAFVSEIRDDLADAILKTEPFILNFRLLHSIIYKIQSSINKDIYEVSYTKFRKSALINVEKFIASDDDSTLQLKKLKDFKKIKTF